MDSLIWALGALIVVILIVYFLPIRFTGKGKFIVALCGFLLALIGLAATSIFPLWEALCMLVVLMFFASYILDSRLGTMLYVQGDDVEKHDDIEDSFEHSLTGTAFTQEKKIEEITPISPNLLNERNQKPENIDIEEAVLPVAEDDDISLLLNRRFNLGEEAIKKKEEPEREVDYLAEIEQLLGDDGSSKSFEAEDKAAVETDGIEEIPVLPFHKKEVDK